MVDLVLEGNIEEIESYYDAIWKRGNTYYCETYAGALYDNRGAYIWATASPIFNNEVDLYGTFVFCNDSLCRIGGYSHEEILNMNYKDIERHNMENEDLTVGISIGWVTSEKPVASLADLFKQADDNMYKEKLRRSSSTREDIIEGFMKVLAQRDYLASGHVTRLQEMGSMMGQEIGISVGEMGALLLLAQVHDIGMVAVPDYIVFKEGKLNDMEWEEIKRHPEVGCRIARFSTRIAHVADLILQHHEWWNGQGYRGILAASRVRIYTFVPAFSQ